LSSQDEERRARVGLCAECRHGHVQRSAKASEFWRCLRADDTDAERNAQNSPFARYPPLPVRECPGFER
jgi:hypothetical protein